MGWLKFFFLFIVSEIKEAMQDSRTLRRIAKDREDKDKR